VVTHTLTVNEIYLSIQGEGTRAGLPCTIVRLTGCNLRCEWCDTQYAWQEGCQMTVEDVLRRVEQLRCRRVEVTGGEPLVQPVALELLKRLCDDDREVLLETNGSLYVNSVDPRVIRIVDFKCPASGMDSANLWGNVEFLSERDEVKFVIADRRDYEYARAAVTEHGLPARCTVIFATVSGRLDLAKLAEWILADNLDVRLGVQLHRIIFPGIERGV